MKAIIENNKTYKVVSERGAFTVCEDEKGKCKMFETSKVSIIEISEMPKNKYAKQSSGKKLNPANFMSDEEYAKSKYATMSKSDFEAEREADKKNSISWQY